MARGFPARRHEGASDDDQTLPAHCHSRRAHIPAWTGLHGGCRGTASPRRQWVGTIRRIGRSRSRALTGGWQSRPGPGQSTIRPAPERATRRGTTVRQFARPAIRSATGGTEFSWRSPASGRLRQRSVAGSRRPWSRPWRSRSGARRAGHGPDRPTRTASSGARRRQTRRWIRALRFAAGNEWRL